MPRPTPISVVIFDLDGTLTAPGHIDFAAMRRDISCPPGRDILSHLRALSDAGDPGADLAWASVEAHEIRALEAVAPREGLIATLEALRARGIPLGVLTRNNRRGLEATLLRLGIAPYFGAIVAREDMAPKPDPAGVFHLAEALGAPPGEALVVGDFVHDIEAGRRAGSRTAWLQTEPGEEAPPGTDFIVHSLHEVLALVDHHPRG